MKTLGVFGFLLINARCWGASDRESTMMDELDETSTLE